jgi:hypothetical protein
MEKIIEAIIALLGIFIMIPLVLAIIFEAIFMDDEQDCIK